MLAPYAVGSEGMRFSPWQNFLAIFGTLPQRRWREIPTAICLHKFSASWRPILHHRKRPRSNQEAQQSGAGSSHNLALQSAERRSGVSENHVRYYFNKRIRIGRKYTHLPR